MASMTTSEPRTASVAAQTGSTLMSRLQKGQGILVAMRDALDAMPDMGVDSPLEAKYVKAIDFWVAMEATQRLTTGETGCIVGFACDQRSPVLCEACAGGPS